MLSDVVTTSFYASHIVTGAGFGGMVCFNDKKLYEKAKILRAWGRSSAIFNENESISIDLKKINLNLIMIKNMCSWILDITLYPLKFLQLLQ